MAKKKEPTIGELIGLDSMGNIPDDKPPPGSSVLVLRCFCCKPVEVVGPRENDGEVG